MNKNHEKHCVIKRSDTFLIKILLLDMDGITFSVFVLCKRYASPGASVPFWNASWIFHGLRLSSALSVSGWICPMEETKQRSLQSGFYFTGVDDVVVSRTHRIGPSRIIDLAGGLQKLTCFQSTKNMGVNVKIAWTNPHDTLSISTNILIITQQFWH